MDGSPQVVQSLIELGHLCFIATVSHMDDDLFTQPEPLQFRLQQTGHLTAGPLIEQCFYHRLT